MLLTDGSTDDPKNEVRPNPYLSLMGTRTLFLTPNDGLCESGSAALICCPFEVPEMT